MGILAALGAGRTFQQGNREVVAITFNVSPTASGRTVRIEFGDSPAPRQVGGANQSNLPATFTGGAVTISAGLEGDVNNDNKVDLFDVQAVAAFAAGLRTAQPGGEFQRADCSPRQGSGNARIDLFDVQQTASWAVGLDLPIPPASGPTQPGGSSLTAGSAYDAASDADSAAARTVRVLNATANANGVVKVIVELEAQGDENAMAFSLNYDNPQLLTDPQVALGKDVTGANTLLQVNTQQAAQGRLGILAALGPGRTFPAGNREVAVIMFTVGNTTSSRVVNFNFSDTPTKRQVGGADQRELAAGYASGTVTVNPAVRSVANVSAASFAASAIAPESIVAAFGTGLATEVRLAGGLPLPTQLAGTRVKVKDSAGVERLAPLFFVAPNQINYLMPAGAPSGAATVTVTSGDGTISAGEAPIASVAPALFTANSSGQGVAAAVALRVKPDGRQIFEPIAQFDPAQNRMVAIPIDLGPEGDQVFLILYGTGLRSRSSLSAVAASVGGVNSQVLYAGVAEGFVGLDQINLSLPRSLAGRGAVEVSLTVEGKRANPVTMAFK